MITNELTNCNQSPMIEFSWLLSVNLRVWTNNTVIHKNWTITLSKLAHIHNKIHLTLEHRKSSLGWKTLTTPKEFMMPEWCRGLVATVRMIGPYPSFIHRKRIKRGWESQTLLRKRWWCLCRYFHAYVPAAGHVKTRPGGSFPKIGPRGQRWAY